MVGVTMGMLIAFATVRWIEGLLHIPTRDAISFLAAAGLTLGLAAFAGWVPARRAAAIDPMAALRAD